MEFCLSNWSQTFVVGKQIWQTSQETHTLSTAPRIPVFHLVEDVLMGLSHYTNACKCCPLHKRNHLNHETHFETMENCRLEAFNWNCSVRPPVALVKQQTIQNVPVMNPERTQNLMWCSNRTPLHAQLPLDLRLFVQTSTERRLEVLWRTVCTTGGRHCKHIAPQCFIYPQNAWSKAQQVKWIDQIE